MRASKPGINSACGGCFQRIASILSGALHTSKEAIPLIECSNSEGPPTRGALASQRAENKVEAGQAGKKETARLVGQIV